MGNFNMLPSDIIVDILSRLPTESVLDCKLVSKPWRNLVRRPCFSKIHLNRHLDSGKSSFIFYRHDHRFGLNEFHYSEYDDNCHEAPFNGRKTLNLSPPFDKYSVVGSCHGLVCLNGYVKEERGGSLNYGPAYICNPITREYVMLPTSTAGDWWTGFGYVLSTDEYKVIRLSVIDERDPNVSAVQVYTLGSGKGWRNAGTIDIRMQRMSEYAGAFANGALHWVDRVGSVFLAFHLADEKFSQPTPPPVPLLSPDGNPYFFIMIGVLTDSLSVTYNYDAPDYGDGESEIWLLKKNQDNSDLSWSKEFSFDTHMIPPFEFTKSGRLLCSRFGQIYSYKPKACSYNPNVSSTKINVRFEKHFSEVIPHRNTLISLKVLGEKDTKTMECGERASSVEEKENNDKLKKLQNEVRDR